MANTQFTPGTVITSSWLNDVNNFIYSTDIASEINTTVGTVSRTLTDKLSDYKTVEDYGAKGDNVTDDTSAIQLAINSNEVIAFSAGTYLLSAAITIPSNRTLLGFRQATLKLVAGANSHVIRIVDGADNVVIDGFIIDGQKSVNPSGGNGISTGAGTGNTSIIVRNNYVQNCKSNGIYFAGTTVYDIDVSHNSVTNCDLAGITADGTVTRFSYNNNRAWLNGTHGIGVIGIAKNGTISDNVSWDNGQVAPSADNLTGYNNSNDSLVISNNVSRGGLNNGIHFGGTNITYTGNTATGAAKYGIAHAPSGAGTCDNLVMVGNLSYGNTLSGFYIINSTGGTVTGNRSLNNVNHGFLISGLSKYVFSGNVATGNGNGGLSVGAACTTLLISSNNFSSNTTYGLSLSNTTTSIVTDNQINNNGYFGIVGGGTEGENAVKFNTLISNASGTTDSLNVSDVVYGTITNGGAANSITGSGKITLATSPTFTTNITTPSIYGGTAVNQSLTYVTTSGVGTSGADHIFKVGNNGATEAMRILNNGNVGVNNSAPAAKLDIGVPSLGDALRISNTSLSGRGWEFYPVTNGTDTDLRLFEYSGASGDRARFKSGGTLEWLGQFSVATVGKGLAVKEGANAKQGTATLVAGTITVANTSVTATSRILLTSQQDGGTPGFLRVSSRVAGTSFTITSSSGTDTSTVAYQIFEPA